MMMTIAVTITHDPNMDTIVLQFAEMPVPRVTHEAADADPVLRCGAR